MGAALCMCTDKFEGVKQRNASRSGLRVSSRAGEIYQLPWRNGKDQLLWVPPSQRGSEERMRKCVLLWAAEAFSFSVGLLYLWRWRLRPFFTAFCTITICLIAACAVCNSRSFLLPCLCHLLSINLLSFKQKIGPCKPNTMICVMNLFKFLPCFIKLLLYLCTAVQVLYFNISSGKLNVRKSHLACYLQRFLESRCCI